MLCVGCLTAANAQTFTQRIQQKGKKGEGTLTVTHDKTIDELVNKQGELLQERKTTTKVPATASPKTTTESTVAKKTEHQVVQQNDTAVVEQPLSDNQRKVMVGGVKMNGYRVQAFAGGNSRTDRQKAEQIGNTLKSHFPNEPIYVHFNSPRWICRMGNYRTMEEAHEMLMNVRKIGITGASVVKAKITVKY